MLLKKCPWQQLNKKLEGKKIIIFGVGSNYRYCIEPALSEMAKNCIAYAVDNNPDIHKVLSGKKELSVYRVEKLKEETSCTVLLCGLDHLYEMYQQLESMQLPDSIECYPVPLLLAEYCGTENAELKELAFDVAREEKIPRVIHTFWFSGDEIPNSYRICIESWKKCCPDYEIHVWDTKDYDVKKMPFVECAINARKWAFASDYARLDVLNEFGGIYMDMDVELEKPLEALLGNDAFFTFESGNEIEPAIIGSRKGYPALIKMMDAYKGMEFRDDDDMLKEYCMPHLMRKPLEQFGVRMDGSMQIIDGGVFLPRKYFSPMDNVVYELLVKTDETIGVHLMNGAWKATGQIEKKRENNRKLQKLVNSIGQETFDDQC